MNKYLIPAILGAVVALAAVFAVMPVEKASSVHTVINTNLGELICQVTGGGIVEGSSGSATLYDPVNNECFSD